MEGKSYLQAKMMTSIREKKRLLSNEKKTFHPSVSFAAAALSSISPLRLDAYVTLF